MRATINTEKCADYCGPRYKSSRPAILLSFLSEFPVFPSLSQTCSQQAELICNYFGQQITVNGAGLS